MAATSDDDEFRKRITATALANDEMVLLDNIHGELGTPSLDAALTSTRWKDRILGRSETIDVPFSTVWAATGNNIVLCCDIPRRVLRMRLESELEHPELRTDLRHPNLLEWASEQRPALVAAALTILCGATTMDNSKAHIEQWGSFEGWSDTVRRAVVSAGFPDPRGMRHLLDEVDRDTVALRLLLTGLQEMALGHEGISSAEIINKLQDNMRRSELPPNNPSSEPLQYRDLRAAIAELCPQSGNQLPGARSLGNKLRGLRDRVIDSRRLTSRAVKNYAHWYVEDLAPALVESGGSGESVSSLAQRGLAECDWAGTIGGPEPDSPESRESLC